MCVDFLHKTTYLIDVAISGDSRVMDKITEKHQRYTDLKIELQKMWKMRVVILPTVIGTLGTIPLCLEKHLTTLI